VSALSTASLFSPSFTSFSSSLILNSCIIKYRYCAAAAVFCYTAENSHHLKAQVTSKNPQFQEEKISARRKARSQVTMEKSSKKLGLPTPPTNPTRREIAHFTRGEPASVICGRNFYSRNLLAGSSDQLQTQYQDSHYHSAPFLFRQDVSISYWWPLASFSEFI
jgi:hypothetical protein